MSQEVNQVNAEAAAVTNEMASDPGFPVEIDGQLVNCTKRVVNGRILLTNTETGDLYADDYLPGGPTKLDGEAADEALNGGMDEERGMEADAAAAEEESGTNEYTDVDRVANGESEVNKDEVAAIDGGNSGEAVEGDGGVTADTTPPEGEVFTESSTETTAPAEQTATETGGEAA